MPTTTFIALGSNIGDRRGTIDRALAMMNGAGIASERVSTLRDTDPVGGPASQGQYLNGIARATTDKSANELLATLLNIEAQLGRVRTERNGPRTIDLDVIAFGDETIDDKTLVVPHPRLHDRLFVLEPLAEIAPDWIHPVFGKSASALLTSLRQRLERETTASSGRELAGLRAMVTGSTSGIGRAIALILADAGADVLVHGRRADAAQEVVDLCRQQGVQSEVLLADCADPSACVRLVDAAWRTWNGLDIWIHNAGADTLTGPAARASFEVKLQTLYDVDLRGTIVTTRRVGHWMKQRGQGSIVTIGWDQSETGMEGDSGQLFGAVKAAVTAYSKSLSLTLAPEVRVNIIAPGWIRTAWGEKASEVWQERVRRETPLAVWGTPEDIAAAARWLVSPAAQFMTGQTIRVNGGAVR
jgi:3-oxoacyl-[acyl-carrier protein] reductase